MMLYLGLFIVAPVPRSPHDSEKQYITILPDGSISKPETQPCWFDKHVSLRAQARNGKIATSDAFRPGEAEVLVTVVVPAYNEEQRMSGMLEEAVEYLQSTFPQPLDCSSVVSVKPKGWEILIISDGSTDQTIDTALSFARSHQLSTHPPTPAGPWTSNTGPKTRSKSAPKVETVSTTIPHGSIRVISLEQNRGKGGAVTHGMRHARGAYIVFADADGASRFSDLGKLMENCDRVADDKGRAVGVGSRAHMVGSEAVVKRSFLRNALMHSFHLLLRLLTPPATSSIKDTQCGFKLFTRPALPYIIPYMHSEGWIFDVEMLMLAESAGIPMAEVAIGWKEVGGSKLNVVWDSLGMAWGLAVLRAAWMVFAVSTLVVDANFGHRQTVKHKHDRIYVRGNMAKGCLNSNFGHRQIVKYNKCHTYDDGFHTLKARVVLGKLSLLAPKSADITSHKHCNSALTRDSKAS
ncbi:dolichyl-phosphate beta-glucosyltransferase [Aureobasidium pullulans]|uniref:dolichyl-phosphate beta-glucosyltransferase n=1 Tax=Aureobasidium pullulans TaxID=5580 RepID=A0A4S8WL60_AURPU|nr:dolichyl-phosphate beta-glucosyltransferase [Aureobasidium pullulans]THW25761.1 dolichyl-phosphate beta-glucosyltransferase [Aureobasidium pullulans]THW61036.1 dolichyl-phosphate beta-glucosyltransferase [Aureobasidium pullulans]TIA02326.1 dolichyl-phosphate beta-glucosyltransferase [Aureobasidium pullulans]